MHQQLAACASKHLGPEGFDRIASCLQRVDRGQLWAAPNEASNSIGNLCLHLAGNLRQWIVAGIGGATDRRQRSREFSQVGHMTRDEVLQHLRGAVERSCDVIGEMRPEDWLAEYAIQGFTVSGIEAVIHVVEHFSYHTGQISLLTKLWTDAALDYYAGVDLEA